MVVLVVAAYFALNYVTDKVLNAMVPQADELLERIEAGSSPKEVMNKETPSSNKGQAGKSTGQTGKGDGAESKDGGQQKDGQDDKAAQPESGADQPDSGADQPDSGADQPDGDAVQKNEDEGSGQTNGEAPSKPSGYHAEISTDQAKSVKEGITLSEKLTVTSILLNRLSADDIQLFSDMFSGGVTLEEKKKAKKLILDKLSEEEYDELIAIASKYGLSKGKRYKDSLEESK